MFKCIVRNFCGLSLPLIIATAAFAQPVHPSALPTPRETWDRVSGFIAGAQKPTAPLRIQSSSLTPPDLWKKAIDADKAQHDVRRAELDLLRAKGRLVATLAMLDEEGVSEAEAAELVEARRQEQTEEA